MIAMMDQDAAMDFFEKYEECGIYVGINYWMLVFAFMVYFIMWCGLMKCACNYILARRIMGFITLYQFVFAFYGIPACIADDDLMEYEDGLYWWIGFLMIFQTWSMHLYVHLYVLLRNDGNVRNDDGWRQQDPNRG